MKYAIALLVIFNPWAASAQKHNLYADAGISFASFFPGLSVTYNYRPVKYIGLGIGVQGYKYYATVTNPDHFTPAIYGDIRINIRPKKKGQLFTFLDLGMNFYSRSTDSTRKGNVLYQVAKDNGFYAGLGFGYFRRVTKKGGGAYLSLKMISNWYTTNTYNLVTKKEEVQGSADATIVFSVGFRF